jgi:hypothetical protein
MQHRGFLKLAFVLGLGIAAGTVLPVPGADAAPLSPAPIVREAPQSANENIHRAVTTREEAARLAPQQVRWGHRWHHRHWHRHWGWHHRHWRWHHRHWGWHHHWHHRHWRHW